MARRRGAPEACGAVFGVGSGPLSGAEVAATVHRRGRLPTTQKYVKTINAFYEGVFNPWLNLHRPCLLATETVSEKGKIKKVYKNTVAKTPLERLAERKLPGMYMPAATDGLHGVVLGDLISQ